MAHKFDVSERGKLDQEERRALLLPEKTLKKLGFHEGSTMADIGCGTGLFSLAAAKLADVTVYAIDISQEMLDEVIKRTNADNLHNIIPVKSEEYQCKLEAETADFVLLCTVLHEVDDKVRFLAEAARICRDGGTVSVIEFEMNAKFGPPISHRLPSSDIAELLKGVNLTEIHPVKISEAFYAVTAKKLKR